MAVTMVRRSRFQLEFGVVEIGVIGFGVRGVGGKFFLEETEKTVQMRTRAGLMETMRIVSGHATVRCVGYPV